MESRSPVHSDDVGQGRTDQGHAVDVVDFASPLGPLGRLVDRLVLTRYMTGLLEQRNRWSVEELTKAA